MTLLSIFSKESKSIFLLALLTCFVQLSASAQVALRFDSSQMVRTSFSGITGSNARTVEAWIKTPNLGTTQMVICDMGVLSPNGSRFTFNLINGKTLRVEIGGSGISGTTSLNNNVWHHVGAVYDPTATNKVTLLLDNSVETSGNFTVSMNTLSIIPFRIGVRCDTINFFKGVIDEVRVYNYARTLAQFTADTQSYCGAQTGLVAYYKLNEGVPNAANASNNIATDYSGFSNDGILKSFSLAASSASNWDTGKVISPITTTPLLSLSSSVGAVTCTGTSVTFTATPTFPGTAPVYQWKVNSIVVGTNSPTYSYMPLNGDVVSCSMTSNYPCASTTPVQQSITMTVNAPPAAPTVSSPVVYCQNVSATALTATGTNLLWYTGSTGGIGTSAITPTTGTAGSTNYYVTQSLAPAAGGCESPRAPITVTVNALPAAPSVSSPLNLCLNAAAATLSATGSNLLWYNTATLGTGATSAPVVTPSAVGSSNYYVSQTSSVALGACESPRATLNVIVNALPVIAITPSTPIAVCSGSGAALTGTGGVTYTWSPGSSLSASTGTTVTATPSGTTTYTVTGTDANGCTNADTKIVTVIPPPTISVSPSTAIAFCAGGSASLTANGATTYSWSPTAGLSATTGSTVTASPSSTSTYTVIGTDANGCTNSASKIVSVNPLPTIGVSPTSAITFCASTGSSLLTANGAISYAWSPATGLSATTGASVTASPLSSITYTVSGTDANGCVNTATKLISVNPLPVLSISPSTATSICNGSNVLLSVSSGTATGFLWTPATGLSATTGSSVTAAPTTTTTYTISGSDAVGCTGTITKTITVLPAPTVSVSPSAATVFCTGQSATLTASGASTYLWSPSGSLSASTGAVVIASPTSTTTYTLTGTDANGCSNATTKLITINPLPAISITPATSTSICIGSGVALTASGASTYAWSPASGLSGVTGATVNASPAATATYSITGTDANGCVNTTTKQVIVNPLPTISISPSTLTTICSGNSVTITAIGASTYSWTPALGLSATTGASVTATPGTSTTYIATGTDANGCTGTSSKLINVNPTPTVSVLPATATSICVGNSVTLTASGASSYSWTPTAGLSSGTAAIVTASPSTTTSYTVTGTDANGCAATATKNITVNAVPTVTLTPTSNPINLCIGSTVNLTANGATSYSWSPTTSLVPTTGATVISSATTNVTYTVTGTDLNGCVNTASRQILVHNLPAISVSPAAPSVICAGSSSTFTASGGISYSWSPSGSLSSGTAASVTATPAGSTIYTVTGTDAFGCTNTANKTVSVNPLPVINVSPLIATAICAGTGVTLTASGASTYIWTPVTGLSSSTTATTIANPASTSTYTVTGTDANGCVNSTTKTVTVNGLPTVGISPPTAIVLCSGNSANLTGTGALSYSWTPSTGLSATSGTIVTATPGVTTTYTVTGTNANGCMNSASKTVTINPSPDPTITPSGYINVCQNDTVYFSAVPGYSNYVWKLYGVTLQSGAVSTLSTFTGGFYTMTVTDGIGCVSTTPAPAVITITQHPVPKIKASGSTLDAGKFSSYQWFKNGVAIPGATNRTFTIPSGGDSFTVAVTDTTALKCPGISEPYRFTGVGVNGTNVGNDIHLFPNPSSDFVTIDAPIPVSVMLFSMEGKLLGSFVNVNQIDLSSYPDGIYRVVIGDLKGAYLTTDKVLKLTR